jgi:hypothetical protein
MCALMLYQPFSSDATALDLAEELGRARRIFLVLNDPDDLRILEVYIAELEARQRFTDETSARPS